MSVGPVSEDFMNKKKITARDIVNDIRNGMDDNALIQKYEISKKQLHGLFDKLIKAALLTPKELDERPAFPVTKRQTIKSEEIPPEIDKQDEGKIANKKTITVGWLLGWLFGVLFFLVGLMAIWEAPLSGLLLLAMAVLLIPPATNKIGGKFSIKLAKSVKALLLIVCFIFVGILFPSQDKVEKPSHSSESQKGKGATLGKTEDIAEGNYEIRKVRWGMTIDEVKATEKDAPFVEEQDFLGYKEKILDEEFDLGYIFKDKKLEKVGRRINQPAKTKENIEDIFVLFERLDTTLKEKYGDPKFDFKCVHQGNILDLDPYKTDTFREIAKKKLYVLTEWQTITKFIRLAIEGKGDSSQLFIGYFAKKGPILGDIVTFDDSEWTVIEVKDEGYYLHSSYQFQEPAKTEGKFVMVIFQVENKTKKEERIAVTPKIIDSQGREFSQYDEQSFYIPKSGKTIASESLPPNIPKKFYGIYEIPKDATDLKFETRSLSMYGEKKIVYLGF